jgi:hypothetical protein
MFYNQPLAIRFGHELTRHLEDPTWLRLDIAVAWIRESGISHIREPLTAFLRRGGSLSVIVGLDLQNTTRQGLEALLALGPEGATEFFVHHNEAAGIFHTKLYLFRNNQRARLIVGSNNITEAGLFVNVEAGLEMEVPLDNETIREALDALASWKDEASGLARRLDAGLLGRLVVEGYVPDEDVVRAAERERRNRARPRGGAHPPLFRSRRFTAPLLEARIGAVRPEARRAEVVRRPQRPGGQGAVLLMRLRMARGTQTQIPIALFNTGFFGGGAIISSHSGVRRNIREAQARGGRNTLKLEIPETRPLTDPVARFERTPEGIVYEVYDVGSPMGRIDAQSVNADKILPQPTPSFHRHCPLRH